MELRQPRSDGRKKMMMMMDVVNHGGRSFQNVSCAFSFFFFV